MLIRLRRCLGDTRGGAALEFALVAAPFIGFVLGLAAVAFNIYLQFVLDYSLRNAARQVQLGAVAASTTAADFTANVFCPIFGRFVACTGIVMTMEPVSDYLNAAVVAPPAAGSLGSSAGFCPGRPGQLMFARAVYLATPISRFWPYATEAVVGGADYTVLVSTAAFANENPYGSAIPAGGGC